ncbi:hypothetical protein E2C01_018147 [Portunus trituberculatus]|uniref:Uncharacterized protein n=1 Tax=Portunus trituberculatus TaxID=210409 RepID=A0A5B7DVE3_PORTR|nr:hypothetical protein [Portunus trituberculatus]
MKPRHEPVAEDGGRDGVERGEGGGADARRPALVFMSRGGPSGHSEKPNISNLDLIPVLSVRLHDAHHSGTVSAPLRRMGGGPVDTPRVARSPEPVVPTVQLRRHARRGPASESLQEAPADCAILKLDSIISRVWRWDGTPGAPPRQAGSPAAHRTGRRGTGALICSADAPT